jgi:two-component system sensor histidine kinase QseC
MRSIKTRLLALALGAVAVVWVGAVAFTYFDARKQIDELLDAHLAQAASLLIAQTARDLEEIETERIGPRRYSPQVAFQVWERGRRLRLHSANAPDKPLGGRSAGFSERVIDGTRWRVYSAWDAEGEMLIHVGERMAVRTAIAGDISEHLLQPLLVALPLLAILLWLAVGRGLNPLVRLAAEVGHRKPTSLEPLDTADAPTEVRPLIEQLNRLFARVTASLQNERRFTADAAHELRTPLAAIRAQAQVARAATAAAERQRALVQVIHACDRTTRLMEQLLTLARLDRAEQAPRETCRLRTLAAEVVGEIAPIAHDAGVDLSLEPGDEVDVPGIRDLLHVLLRNLIDNAVRYSPKGTTVRIATERRDGHAFVTVTDDGPGIPPVEREKVLERFYRGLGTDKPGAGLGLSIVKRICELHDAELHLDPAENGRGLRVTIVLGRSPVST